MSGARSRRPVLHSGELLGVVNFEGTLDHPIGPAQVALAEMVVHALSARAPLGPPRRRATRPPARHRAGPRRQSRARRRPGPRRGSSRRSSTRSPSSSLPTSVALVSRGADGTFRLEAGVGFPGTGDRPRGHAGRRGMVGRAHRRRGPASTGSRRSRPGQPSSSTIGPAATTPHAAMALPIEVGDEVAAVLFVTRIGADRHVQRRSSCGIADLLTAAGRDRPPERRPPCAGGRVGPARPADRPAQSPLLRRGGRDRATPTPVGRGRELSLDRPRPRPLLGGQQRVRPRCRRRRPAAGRPGDHGRRPRRATSSSATAARSSSSSRPAPMATEPSTPRNGSAQPSPPRARNRSTGGWCRSRSRPGSPASATRPTAAASSAPQTQPSSPPNEPAATESSGSSVATPAPPDSQRNRAPTVPAKAREHRASAPQGA